MYAGRIVETADANLIYEQPRHPYTYGLLQSVPRLDSPRGTTLTPIPGNPPDLVDLPSGCAFHPRCHIGQSNCQTTVPELISSEQAHSVACLYSNQLLAENTI